MPLDGRADEPVIPQDGCEDVAVARELEDARSRARVAAREEPGREVLGVPADRRRSLDGGRPALVLLIGRVIEELEPPAARACSEPERGALDVRGGAGVGERGRDRLIAELQDDLDVGRAARAALPGRPGAGDRLSDGGRPSRSRSGR
jgi:hypothetical protein